jgi:prepilin-type N-terminal cleavage/methylation domain-containing protein
VRTFGCVRPSCRDSDDGGFTLVEVVVAMAVFSLVATGILGLLVQTQRVTGENIRRTTASDLAAAQIEAVRNVPASSPLLEVTTGFVVVPSAPVNGVQYTVTRSVTLAPGDPNTDLCTASTSDSVDYKQVTVRVRWNNMGSTKPVESKTLRQISYADQTVALPSGIVAVRVTGIDGDVPGATVTLTPQSGAVLTQTSDGNGCAVFNKVPTTASSYAISATAAGYSSYVAAGQTSQTATRTITGVSAGQLVQSSVNMVKQRDLSIALDVPTGTVTPTLPTALRFSVAGALNTKVDQSTLCSASPTVGCFGALPAVASAGATTGTVSNLYADTYAVQAGACVGVTSTSTRNLDLRATGATSGPVTIPLGAVAVRVQNLGGIALANKIVTFVRSAPGETCSATESFTATTDATGIATLALPYGSWAVSTTNTGALTGTLLNATVAPSATARTAAVTLKVVA